MPCCRTQISCDKHEEQLIHRQRFDNRYKSQLPSPSISKFVMTLGENVIILGSVFFIAFLSVERKKNRKEIQLFWSSTQMKMKCKFETHQVRSTAHCQSHICLSFYIHLFRLDGRLPVIVLLPPQSAVLILILQHLCVVYVSGSRHRVACERSISYHQITKSAWIMWLPIGVFVYTQNCGHSRI